MKTGLNIQTLIISMMLLLAGNLHAMPGMKKRPMHRNPLSERRAQMKPTEAQMPATLRAAGEDWWEPELIEFDTEKTGENNGRIEFEYDDHGNILSEMLKFKEPGSTDWVAYYRNVYTYNDNNSLRTILYENFEDAAWENSYRDIYTYYEDDKLKTILCEFYEDGAWVYDYRFVYTYYDAGNLEIELLEYYEDDAWVIEYRYTHTYNDDGKINFILSEYYENNVWLNEYRDTYTYNDDGNLKTALREEYRNNAWENKTRYSFSYTEDNKLNTYLYQSWQDASWQDRGLKTYTYNNQGNILTYSGEYVNSNTWVNSYTYDEYGNALTRTVTGTDRDDVAQFTYNNGQSSCVTFFEIVGCDLTITYVKVNKKLGIADTQTQSATWVYAADGVIYVKNIVSGSLISIYDLPGRIQATTIVQDGTYQVSAPSQGVYIVRVGKDSFKVIVE